ncbi:MAG: penicillin-binding protein [Candidatus Curtissbacteria bacterium]|nr:penicillin-binding protein [Candidatus Curtissbacteria bacterium]
MKFAQYRPGARRFSSSISRLALKSHPNHPFLRESGFNKRRFWIKFLGLFSTITFFSLIGLIVLTVFAFIIFARDLPTPYKLTARDASLSTKIYDRNNKLLYDIYGDKNRALVNWNGLPPYVKEATISIEDKDFYKHSGFSAFGILRSAFNIVVFRKLQGGSTITQQVVKNTLLSSERTLTRKVKEFILSIQVERKYSKDEILQIYLNEVPYGGTAWGIEAAAQTYFGREAKDLTLAEAVILAGMPQAPSFYSPYGTNPKAYVKRAFDVGRRMREDGYITRAQEDQLQRDIPSIKFSTNDKGIAAPHFVFYVKDILTQRYGEKFVEQGGLKVTTTLNLDLQNKAQSIVSEEIAKLANLKVGNGAAVIVDPKTGEILAMVGSKDYFAKDYDGQVNVAMSLRQPGSALKPFTYATAFKAGYTPATVLLDVPTEFPGGVNLPIYKPVNYDGKFRGPVQVRFALANSINIPAVKMTALVGIKNMLRTAYDAGLKSLEPTDDNLKRFGLSVTLGGGEVRLLELANGYGTLAAAGTYHDPISILKVEDRSGKVLEEVKDEKDVRGRDVLGKDITFLISHILSDNNARADAFGLGSFLNIPGKTVAVKTGTTDDKRDNWTVGYTPSAVVGVWVGNNDNSPMNPAIASGITGATPIWNRIMREALSGRGSESFQKPDNVTALEIDSLGGGLPCRDLPKRSEYFIKGTEPTRDCLVEKTLNGQDFYVFTEFDPVSTDGKNRWQDGINAWAQTQDARYRPPTDLVNSLSAPGGDINVKITSHSDQYEVTQNLDGKYKIDITAKVTSNSKINKVEFYVGDENGDFKDINDAKKNDSSGTYGFSYEFDSAIAGSSKPHRKLKVKAYNDAGKDSSAEVEVSVGQPY